MDNKRRNELILLSQRICDSANGMLKEYLEKTYAEAGPETMGDQLDDWLNRRPVPLGRARCSFRTNGFTSLPP